MGAPQRSRNSFTYAAEMFVVSVLMKINSFSLKGPYNIRPAWLLPRAGRVNEKMKFFADGQLSCSSGES